MLLYEGTMPLTDITESITGRRMSSVCMPFHESLSQCLWHSFPGLTWVLRGEKLRMPKACRQNLYSYIRVHRLETFHVTKEFQVIDLSICRFSSLLNLGNEDDLKKIISLHLRDVIFAVPHKRMIFLHLWDVQSCDIPSDAVGQGTTKCPSMQALLVGS